VFVPDRVAVACWGPRLSSMVRREKLAAFHVGVESNSALVIVHGSVAIARS
jgi:hypothetical protein